MVMEAESLSRLNLNRVCHSLLEEVQVAPHPAVEEFSSRDNLKDRNKALKAILKDLPVLDNQLNNSLINLLKSNLNEVSAR